MGLSKTDIFRICLYFVIFVTGVIGNGLVIFVTGYKINTTVNSTWFLNLAIADLISILSLIFQIIEIFQEKVWPMGNLMCKFTYFLKLQNMFASVFFLTVISLDRCLCTWLVAWAQNKRNLVKARLICVFVWLSSIFCSIPFAIAYSVKEGNGLKYCSRVISNLTIHRFVVGFLIPFIIITSSYIAIGLRVKRIKASNQFRPFRIISVILAFFICWFPFYVLQMIRTTALTNKWSWYLAEIKVAIPFISGLTYLNSSLNPILYVFMCDEFKRKIKKSLLLVLEGAFTEDHMVKVDLISPFKITRN